MFPSQKQPSLFYFLSFVILTPHRQQRRLCGLGQQTSNDLGTLEVASTHQSCDLTADQDARAIVKPVIACNTTEVGRSAHTLKLSSGPKEGDNYYHEQRERWTREGRGKITYSSAR